MQPVIGQEKAELQQLHAEYRQAWQRFASRVDLWQELLSEKWADDSAIHLSEDKIRQAELEYRTMRNRLADYLLSHSEQRMKALSRADRGRSGTMNAFTECQPCCE